MVGWHHWLDGHEFEQALGVGDGQWRLACYSPWGHKESDTPEWLNWHVGSKLSKHSKESPSNFFLSLRVGMNQASPTPANSLNPSDSSDGPKVSLPTRGTIQDFYQLICPWYQSQFEHYLVYILAIKPWLQKGKMTFWHRMAMIFFRLWRKLVKMKLFIGNCKTVSFCICN